MQQLQHPVLLSDFLDNFFMLEVAFSWLLQLPVDILKLVIEFDFLLHKFSGAEEEVLDLLLDVDLFNFNAAEIFHPVQLFSPFVDHD